MNGGEEIPLGLFVAGGDSAELLDFGEEVLDQMPLFIDLCIKLARRLAVRPDGITVAFPAAASGAMIRASASKALSAIKVSACIEGKKWSAPSRSWAWPPVRTKPTGFPSASTRVWILVLSPPRDRPIASPSPSLFGARAMLMGPHDGAIDHRVIKNPRSKLRGIGGRKEADQKNAASCGEYVPKEIHCPHPQQDTETSSPRHQTSPNG